MMVLYLMALLSVLYLIMIWYFTYGFVKKSESGRNSFDTVHKQGISVIIPVRNEKNDLPVLLNELNFQSASNDRWEVIVVDDYSTDKTVEKAVGVEKRYSFKLLRLSEIKAAPGKKSAINEGIKSAKFPVILVTDADCVPGNGWISLFMKHFDETGCYFAAGLVKIKDPCKGLSGIEALDFYGLIGSSAGSAAVGMPFMCNAANMAFKSDIYYSVGGMDSHNDLSSGDDVMLLHQVVKLYGAAHVRWIKDPVAAVTTKGSSTLGNFFAQRIRWASKSKRYENPVAMTTALIVLMVNLSLFLCMLLPVLGLFSYKFTLFLFAVKALADFPLLYLTARHFGQGCLLKWFIPATILYPVYNTFAGLVSLFWKPLWKGRRIR